MKYADICTMDAQGRVVIPTKIRRFLNLTERNSLEIELAGQEIRLRKCEGFPTGTQKLSAFLTILYNCIQHPAVLCSDTQVITAVGEPLPDGTSISSGLSEYIKTEKELFPDMGKPIYLSPSSGTPIAALFPVHTTDPMSIAVLSKEPLTEVETGCVRLTAATVKYEFI